MRGKGGCSRGVTTRRPRAGLCMEGEPRKEQMTSQAWLPLVTAAHTGMQGYRTGVVSMHLLEASLMKSMGEELRERGECY